MNSKMLFMMMGASMLGCGSGIRNHRYYHTNKNSNIVMKL